MRATTTMERQLRFGSARRTSSTKLVYDFLLAALNDHGPICRQCSASNGNQTDLRSPPPHHRSSLPVVRQGQHKFSVVSLAMGQRSSSGDKINYVKSHGVKIMLTHVSKMFKHRTEQVSGGSDLSAETHLLFLSWSRRQLCKSPDNHLKL